MMMTRHSNDERHPRLRGRPEILFRAGLWAFLGAALVSSLTLAAEKPNLLFLLSDDHSCPFVGCCGDGNVRTPTLDRLAAEGMKFHRFFTIVAGRGRLLHRRLHPGACAYWKGRLVIPAGYQGLPVERQAADGRRRNESPEETSHQSSRSPGGKPR